MKIREAEAGDIRAMAELSGELGYADDPGVVGQRFARITTEPGHAVFVAESEGRVIGWIHVLPRIMMISRPLCEIGALVVRAAARRRGIGRELVARAEEWSRENGCEGMVVRSDSRREEPHLFYPGTGFDFLKEQKVYMKFFQGDER